MYGGGFNQGFGGGLNQPQGFNQGQGHHNHGFNQGQGFNQGLGCGGGGVINLGLGGASNSYGGNSNSGFANVGKWSYNGNWDTNNDTFLRNQISRVYMIYDLNHTGQLEGQ